MKREFSVSTLVMLSLGALLVLAVPYLGTVYSSTQQSELPPQSNFRMIPIATSGDNVYMVWEELVNGIPEVMFTKHIPGGFVGKINLSNTAEIRSENPSIESEGSNVHVTWRETFENGTSIPAYRASTDNGTSFGGLTQLPNIFSK